MSTAEERCTLGVVIAALLEFLGSILATFGVQEGAAAHPRIARLLGLVVALLVLLTIAWAISLLF